jgi:hypothetical protein
MTTLYWSRKFGRFIDKNTGNDFVIDEQYIPARFTGTSDIWHETLVETCLDARNQCVRLKKIPSDQNTRITLRVGAEVLSMLKQSVLFHNDMLGNFFIIKEDNDLTNRILVDNNGSVIASIIIKDM